MGKFLARLVLVVRIAKLVLRVATHIVEVVDQFAVKLSEKQAV